jgi:hypothetical protein
MNKLYSFNSFINENFESKKISWNDLSNSIKNDITENIYHNVNYVEENYWSPESLKDAINDSIDQPYFNIEYKNVNELYLQLEEIGWGISNRNVERLISILEDGEELDPVILNNGKFFDGGHRLTAYKRLGKKFIPTIDIGFMLNFDYKKWDDGHLDFNQKFISTFESYVQNDSDDIRHYAWLYFLAYVYPNGMKNESWKNDNRMDVNFLDSMEKFSDYVIQNDGVWKIKEDKIEKVKEELRKIFKSPTTNDIPKDFNDWLKKYDTNNYPISSIPYEIYLRDEQQKIKNTKIDLKLNSGDYYDIIKWYKKYQRNSGGWWNKLNKYSGLVNDLIRDKKYKLYRGINIKKWNSDELEKWNNLNVGDYIEDNGISWTTSLGTAKRFALGNKHWMENKKTLGKNEVGIVLYHEFTPDEILMDVDFVDEIHPYLKDIADFTEDEVIIIPKKSKYKIVDIIKPK